MASVLSRSTVSLSSAIFASTQQVHEQVQLEVASSCCSDADVSPRHRCLSEYSGRRRTYDGSIKRITLYCLYGVDTRRMMQQTVKMIDTTILFKWSDKVRHTTGQDQTTWLILAYCLGNECEVCRRQCKIISVYLPCACRPDDALYPHLDVPVQLCLGVCDSLGRQLLQELCVSVTASVVSCCRSSACL